MVKKHMKEAISRDESENYRSNHVTSPPSQTSRTPIVKSPVEAGRKNKKP